MWRPAMQSLVNKLKASWGWILVVAGSILALLKLKDKYDTALSHEKNSKTLIKDAELNQKQKSNEVKLQVIQGEKSKALSEAKNSNVKNIEDYYNGKK